ncbi:uncharacterized protein MONBRDRAFT_14895 [Monosiga brevicollis MX1]|uniref:PRP1 splicing factor N-terminal domain-containing protein n=1 Tax=Monosiga brevicollis TaxID=81824 RepID=A9UT83_MONBE|nr:uncharacterized protein MONBRDRAFT_14895 [Monosiga brevicollis MX1]EDQ91448.1 predicted protein [Monosiga brevicollis MX1]|eukprot:XP_001743870.1 hypothetical protein [Monosiga brevicollis MX1]
MERDKLHFLGKEAPPGYVAGIGRGASGFMTRSDIGPARPGGDRAAPVCSKANAVPKEENLNDTNYDEFSGYGGSLFSGGAYDADDKEADAVYDAIDQRLDERRKEHRERREREELLKFRKERPKIQQQFSDLKRDLAEVSTEQWANLPEVADIGKKTKRAKRERFTPMPDNLLGTATAGGHTEIDSRQQKYGGLQTPMPGSQTLMPSYAGACQFLAATSRRDLDLGEIGRARNTMMGVKLDQVSDSVTGQTVVDPKGYLTDMNSLNPQGTGTVADIAKGRQLLAAVRKANPNNGPAWIASAKLEEQDGRIQAARNMIFKGCEHCPKNEDVWLEAVRLQPPQNAKAVVAQGVRELPSSIKLWIKAAELEQDHKAQRRVMRKALETIPDSVKLWKAAVELESPEDACILLGRAVECCPTSTELWLALAHLETYDNARKVLNKARKAVPTDRQIWIAAARLEETAKKFENVERVVATGIKSLQANGVEINRDHWLEEAQRCDLAGSPITAQAIVRAVIGYGIEDEDRKETWIDDAKNFVNHEAFNCARAVYAQALAVYKVDDELWLEAAFFEKEHGTRVSLEEHLQAAVRHCPQAEVLWLMGAKSAWNHGDVGTSRQILAAAFEANPGSEEIWLAAIKLESENNEYMRARKLLERARAKAGTARVWMKSARLEWVLDDIPQALSLLDGAIQRFPDYFKYYLMKGQIYEQCKDIEAARQAFAEGLKATPKDVEVWRCAAELEVSQGNFTRARALLERGRTYNPKSDLLWLDSVRVERRAGNPQAAETVLAKAMQDVPLSGKLWAESIAMQPKAGRRTKSLDASKKCGNSPEVLVALAKMFLSDRKIAKARRWLNSAVKLDPDYGDGWAAYYKFELQYGTEEQQEEVVKHCLNEEPRHGEVWQRVAKDPRNWRLRGKDLLVLVAKHMDITFK